jgi:septum formation protein
LHGVEAKTPNDLILASASAVRAQLLQNADIAFQIDPANIDESAIKRSSRREGRAVAECALALAEAKARHVSAQHPGLLVVGADQILALDDEWFDKPESLAGARRQLERLRGRTHELVTAVCVISGESRLWYAVTVPRLTMREFSDGFLDAYIAAEGDDLLGLVGAYRLEGRGIQLFAGIEGDYFSVLGLPIVELLDYLRTCGTLRI